ncbi:MAG: hypothetical protein H6564_16850 [Lewinellaceae bacterium]|nr:hypothetical protein [Lewinellaceae bacterium]
MKPAIALLIAVAFAFSSNLNAQADSGKASAFTGLFEEVQAGSLHLFSHFNEELPADFAFTGQKIGKKYYGFFSGEYRQMLESGAVFYAVYRMKNDGKDAYIIRMPSNKGPHTFYLFEWRGETLHSVQLLAYAFCADGFCHQQDCWVADLNGDSKVDILTQFRRTLPRSRKVLTSNEQVYLQKDAGRFGIVPQGAVHLESGRFELQELAY